MNRNKVRAFAFNFLKDEIFLGEVLSVKIHEILSTILYSSLLHSFFFIKGNRKWMWKEMSEKGFWLLLSRLYNQALWSWNSINITKCLLIFLKSVLIATFFLWSIRHKKKQLDYSNELNLFITNFLQIFKILSSDTILSLFS